MSQSNDRGNTDVSDTNQAATDYSETAGTFNGAVAGAMIGAPFGLVGAVIGGVSGGAIGHQMGEGDVDLNSTSKNSDGSDKQ